ncbi:hypothetical protein [Carboxylicivirga sp. RSCT41]|uniref:hypothetical protein n=1 Tax=Carboxylicivirga agarovorans TaxID=3417570 RepID=UPI003D33F5C8
MKAKYKFYPGSKLLVEAFYGNIGMSDLIEIVEDQTRHPEFNMIDKTISDIRAADLIVSIEELNAYIGELRKLMEEQPLRWAIVTNKPGSTALSMIIKQDPYFDNRVQIYSTQAAAMRFLGLDLPVDKLLTDNFFIVE